MEMRSVFELWFPRAARKKISTAALVLTLFIGALALPVGAQSPPLGSLVVREIATFNQPIYATAPRNDTSRLFVAERDGVIKILDLDSEQVLLTPFLTGLSVTIGSEGGLLSFAFHPSYDGTNNRRFTCVSPTARAALA